MRRSVVFLVALLVVGVQSLEAQRRCSVSVSCDRRSPPPAAAAGGAEFGVRGGYDLDERVVSAGAQLRFPLAAQLHLAPSADVFLDDAPTQWQLNGDVLFRPAGLGGLYGGGGIALVSRDFDADGARESRTGYNLLLGLDGGILGDAFVRPFVEARWTRVEDYRPFRAVVGVNVPIGGRFR